MSDYISREAVVEFIRSYRCSTDVAIHMEQHLNEIPAADVRPVKRGKWLDHQQWQWVYAKCSECETVHDVRSNFCPNCGADMRVPDIDVGNKKEPPKEVE